MLSISFEWDPKKDRSNQAKHGVGLAEAQGAFLDKRRVLAEDLRHSTVKEPGTSASESMEARS
jgi:uncharacterized DUF497 family protein